MSDDKFDKQIKTVKDDNEKARLSVFRRQPLLTPQIVCRCCACGFSLRWTR